MGQEKNYASSSSKQDEEGSNTGSSLARTTETLLRVMPMGLCLSALIVMLKNSEENENGQVAYSDLTAFNYLVYANAICAAYSLLSAFFTAMPKPGSLPRAWTFFLLDQLLTYMILAAVSVSLEIIFLAYKGDEKVTWSKECNVFNGFCRKATISVGITAASVACYILLSLISSYRLFSAFDAPVPFLSSKSVEITAFPR